MRFKDSVAILGSTGFIGHHLLRLLKDNNFNVKGYCRPKFDLTSPDTYPNFPNDPVTIIDAITVIDDINKIYQTNVEGFKGFITFLKDKRIEFNYIYLSTISIKNKDLINSNQYIHSKFLAEQYLRDMVGDYKIIRLSYPFGENEGENRLLTRLVRKVLNNEEIRIKEISLQLTPIQFLTNKFLGIAYSEDNEIDFLLSEAIRLAEIISKIHNTLDEVRKANAVWKSGNSADSLDFKKLSFLNKEKLFFFIEEHAKRIASYS